MSESKAEVTIKCITRVAVNRATCRWELKATSIEEAADMHRLHVERVHS